MEQQADSAQLPLWRKIFGSYTKKQKAQLTPGQRTTASIVSLAWVVVVVTILRSSLLEPYRIPTPSMVPTLMVGDHIFVSKLAYGLKLPWPLSDGGLIEKKVMLWNREGPQAGDVIVFEYPRDRSVNYVKRVVALPTQTLSLKDNRLYINDQEQTVQALEDAEKLEYLKTFFKNPDLVTIQHEKLGSREHLVAIDDSNGIPFHANYPHNGETSVVPENHYFVMGDNRNNSADSRFWGFVHRDLIKGRAMMVWFSLHVDTGIDTWDVGQWSTVFNPSRIGLIIK